LEVSSYQKRGILATPQTEAPHHKHSCAVVTQFVGSYIDVGATKLLKSFFLPHNEQGPAGPAALGEVLLRLSNANAFDMKMGHTNSSMSRISTIPYFPPLAFQTLDAICRMHTSLKDLI